MEPATTTIASPAGHCPFHHSGHHGRHGGPCWWHTALIGLGGVALGLWLADHGCKHHCKSSECAKSTAAATSDSSSHDHEKSKYFRQQKTSGMIPEMHDYVVSVATRQLPQHRLIEEYTKALGRPARMMVSPDEGQALQWLCRTLKVKVAIEVGCFTGYGTLWIASGASERVFTLDISDDHLAHARKQWDASGHGGKVEHLLGDARVSLDGLRQHGTGPDAAALIRGGAAAPSSDGDMLGDGTVDFAFVDADKASYPVYVEQVHKLLRTGGICAIDNTLWGGRVLNPSCTDADTTAIRELNRALHDDDRWDICLLPIADGLTLLRKRG